MNEQKTEIPPIELAPTDVKITDAPVTVVVETPLGSVTVIEQEIKDIAVEVVAPDHKARAHHKNSPSKLPYLSMCPGFKSDETGDKDAAEQGTRLHEHMDSIVQNWTKDSGKSMLQYLDELCNTVAVDADERALLVYCVRELVDWLSRSGAEIVQEIRVEIHRPDGTLATAGHLDLLLIFGNGMGLLIDYKFGWLRVKDAKDNEQGLTYAIGCFEKFPKTEAHWNHVHSAPAGPQVNGVPRP
jgi:ATP-dependent exoDNAse (exonuclease V) beta subunit